jgi:hypothetical protein
MTADPAALEQGLRRLEPASNTSPTNTAAESYTLAFRRAYDDPATGWTDGTRKVVVAFGDAEPHNAGRAGLAGCADMTPDPNNMDLLTELDRLRQAQRSLLMVFIPSSAASTNPTCYDSIASRVNRSEGAPTSVPLGTGVAPAVTQLATGLSVRVARSAKSVRRGRSVVLTVTVRNRGTTTVGLRRLALSLPQGLRFRRASGGGLSLRAPQRLDRSLSWAMSRAMPRGSSLRVRVYARGEVPGRFDVGATARFAGTPQMVVRSPWSSVRVTRVPPTESRS